MVYKNIVLKKIFCYPRQNYERIKWHFRFLLARYLMIFLVSSCRTLTRLKYSTLRRTEGVPRRRAINVRRFTYFVVHPRAHSPIFHHFKTQFASARPTILARRSDDEFVLSFLSFFYLFLLHPPSSVSTLTTPDNRSLSFRAHRSRLPMTTSRHPYFA